VIQDGVTVSEKNYGLANVELSVPVTSDTVYEIASMTKGFTAAAILLLVAEGKLSLDESLARFRPALPDAWQADEMETDALWMQVFDLYYAVFLLSEILPVADLRDPTVRKSFVLAQEILQKQGRLDLQEAMFALLGCQAMSRTDVEALFAVYTEAFDQASLFLRTPFFFSSEVSANSRPVSVGGVREIIDSGLHREAMFWMMAIYSIAVKVMQNDAPDAEKAAHLQQYRQQLADLGLRTKADIIDRAEQLKALAPTFMEVAEKIMDYNPAIQS
jgi:hypothetical protein